MRAPVEEPKVEPEKVMTLDHFAEGLDMQDVTILIERFSKIGTEPQQPLAEIVTEKHYESHLPDFFQTFEERGMEVPVGYEEIPFQDEPFFVPEPKEDHILGDLSILDESRISARRDAREEEERRLKESEEVYDDLIFSYL